MRQADEAAVCRSATDPYVTGTLQVCYLRRSKDAPAHVLTGANRRFAGDAG